MSKKITAENGAGIEVGQLGITVVHPEGIAKIWARLTDAQRVELAAALDPGRRGLHVRLDNQAKTLAMFQQERDEWKARAEVAEQERDEWESLYLKATFRGATPIARAEAAEARTTPAATREKVSQVVHGVLSTWYDNEDVVDAVCDLFGVGAGQAVDPVEAKARELYEHVYVGRFEDGSSGVQAEYRKLAAYLIGQEGCHVDR